MSKKKDYAKKQISKGCECEGQSPCRKCMSKAMLLDKYERSNMPLLFWNKEMDTFKGNDAYKEFLTDYANNVEKKYYEGKSWCLAGGIGRGKTFGSSYILKAATAKGLDCWYDTMLGIVANKDGFFRSRISKIDYLVIDEVDSRFLPQSQAGIDHISGALEFIVRTRCHNMLPTIICTNEEDGIVYKSFNEMFQRIFESLTAAHFETFFVAGKDYRRVG